jgi:hypothetical protein
MAILCRLVEAAGQVVSKEVLEHAGWGTAVVSDGQAFQHAAFRRPIEHEVRRPDFIRRDGSERRRAVGDRHLLPAPAFQLEPRLRIQPVNAL